MLVIPHNIRDIAKAQGINAGPVVHWLLDQLAAVGLTAQASPADWPADVWAAYTELKGDAGAVGANTSSLFEKLDISDSDA